MAKHLALLPLLCAAALGRATICLSSVACVYILTRCPPLHSGHRLCMLARRCKRATRSRSATETSVTWRSFLCLSSDLCWRVCLGAAPPRHVDLSSSVLCFPHLCVRWHAVCAHDAVGAHAHVRVRAAPRALRVLSCRQSKVHPAFPLPLPACCLPVCSCCVHALPLALLPPFHHAASAAGGLTGGLVGTSGCGASGILLSRVCVSTSASPADAGDCAQVP